MSTTIALAALIACEMAHGRSAQAQATTSPPMPAAVSARASAALLANFDSAWAAVSRSYWDTAFVNGPWRLAHDSLRPIAAAAEDMDGIRAAIRALIAVPKVSHFVLIPQGTIPTTEEVDTDSTGADPAAPVRREPASARSVRAGPGTTGIEVRPVGDTIVVWRVAKGSAAARAGIRPGDIVARVGTMGVDTVRARIARAIPGDATHTIRLTTLWVTGRLAGTSGDTLGITLRDGPRGRARPHRLVRTPIPGRTTRFGNLPPLVVALEREEVALGRGSVAPMFSFTAWFPVLSPEIDRALFAERNAPGIIIDLRGNPGGVVGMVAGVSGHFLDSAIALGTMHGRGATIRFVANPRRVNARGERVEVIRAPMAILIDGMSGSTSEFFASGMQGLGRARVFGERSMGAALPATPGKLPNGDVLMHVIADHEDAVGRRVEGVGVTPDEVTPLTRRDLRAGRDAALEAARGWLARRPR